MSVHFSRYPDDDGPEQAPCGIWIGDASDLSSDWSRVDCKRCLKWKDTIMATHEAEQSAIVEQMGDMAEFMKRTAGEQMTDSVSIYKLGIYGKAYDVPGTRRAYTYQHQPDNLGASKLGGACFAAFKAGGGDYIDYGLGLLKQLELRGFGVYELDESKASEEHQEPVAFRCKLSIHKDWKYIDHRAPDSFELRECEIQPLFTGPQTAQVNRIPAGLYAELEALRTLRDATGVYLQSYMRDEIEDEESCSADQHDSACTVKLALDKARELEWKGGDK